MQEANPNGRRLLGLAALAQLELEAAWRRRFGGHGVTLREWGAEVRAALVGALVFAGGAVDESDASVTRAGVQACTAGPFSRAPPPPRSALDRQFQHHCHTTPRVHSRTHAMPRPVARSRHCELSGARLQEVAQMVAQLGHGAFLGSYVCARLHDLAPSIVASDDSAAASVVACVHSQFRLRSEELRQVRAMREHRRSGARGRAGVVRYDRLVADRLALGDGQGPSCPPAPLPPWPPWPPWPHGPPSPCP